MKKRKPAPRANPYQWDTHRPKPANQVPETCRYGVQRPGKFS